MPVGSLVGGELSLTSAKRHLDVGSFFSASWMRNFERDVNRLASLRTNWDSYSGAPLQEKAVLKALELLTALEFTGPAPWLSPTPDGGIHLEWNENDLELTLDIDSTGTIEVVADYDNGELQEWTANVWDRDDERIAVALARISDARNV